MALKIYICLQPIPFLELSSDAAVYDILENEYMRVIQAGLL